KDGLGGRTRYHQRTAPKSRQGGCMLRKLLLSSFILAGLSVSSADAGKVKVWSHYNQGHYDKAELKGAVVSSEGTLRLSRQLRPLASIDATHVWDVIEDRTGNLIVATGDEGKLFKITPDGKTSVIYASPDSQILSLAMGADGTVYAGTGPSGTIVAVPPQRSEERRVGKEGRSRGWRDHGKDE